MCLLWLSENSQTNESKNPVKKITGLTVIAPLNLHFGSILVLSLSLLPMELRPVLYHRTSGFKNTIITYFQSLCTARER